VSLNSSRNIGARFLRITNEVGNVSRRDYCTGLYFGAYDAKRVYVSGDYVRSYDFVGETVGFKKFLTQKIFYCGE